MDQILSGVAKRIVVGANCLFSETFCEPSGNPLSVGKGGVYTRGSGGIQWDFKHPSVVAVLLKDRF